MFGPYDVNDALTLALGVAIALGGAAAYWLTLLMTGLALGVLGGGAIGAVICRLAQIEPPAMLMLCAVLAAIGGWFGYSIARKANAFLFGLLGFIAGCGIGWFAADIAPELVGGTDIKQRLTAVGIGGLAIGLFAAVFQRQVVAIVAACIGGLLIATSFDPFLPPQWLAATAGGLLVTQAILIGTVKKVFRSAPRKE